MKGVSSPQDSDSNHPDLDSYKKTTNDVGSNDKDKNGTKISEKYDDEDDADDDRLKNLMMTSSTITVTSEEVTSSLRDVVSMNVIEDDNRESTTIINNKKRDTVSVKPKARYRVVPNVSYDCEVGWRQQDKKCYKIAVSVSTGDEASNTCLMLYSAQAATITSRGQSEMLVAMINQHRDSLQQNVIALNGKRVGIGERFSWSTSENFDFKNWAAAEPSNYKNGFCFGATTLSSAIGQWKVIPCDAPVNVLCSKNAKETIEFDSNKLEEIIEESSTMPPVVVEIEVEDNDEGKQTDNLHLEPEDESIVDVTHLSENEESSQPKTKSTSSLTLCLFILSLVAVMLLVCFIFGLKKRRRRRNRNRRSSRGSSNQESPTSNGDRKSSKEGPIFLEKSDNDPSVYVDNNRNSSETTKKKNETALLS